MRGYAASRASADAIELVEVPTPQASEDELLVRVKAVGVGIHDSYFLPEHAQHPYVVGIEAAGVVEAAGAGIAHYRAGDRIAFVSSMQPKGGTWAEFAVVSATSLIVPMPSDVDFVTAAAIPVAGNTTVRALSALNRVPAGGTLFIAGGSGAIGTLAIQLATQRGWRVGASASAANHNYMRSLGAEMVTDYQDPDWTNQVRQWMPDGVDAALAIPPGTAAETLRTVKDNGQLVPVSGDSVKTRRDVRVEAIPYGADVRDELVKLMADVATGTIHIEIEHVYPFNDALDALTKVQTRRARGKVVLRMP